jgi:hypothetical protein
LNIPEPIPNIDLRKIENEKCHLKQGEASTVCLSTASEVAPDSLMQRLPDEMKAHASVWLCLKLSDR